MHSRDKIKLVFLFVLTYLFLFFLPAITQAINPSIALHDWGFTLNPSMLDYTFFLMPFVGFFFIYFLIDWANDYFKTNFGLTVYFPLLFVVLSFLAFYIQLVWYYSNITALAAASGQALVLNVPLFFDSVCSAGQLSFYSMINGQQALTVCYWNVLRNDAFLVFVFSGLAGWISKKVMQRVSEEALEKRKPLNVQPAPVENQPEFIEQKPEVSLEQNDLKQEKQI